MRRNRFDFDYTRFGIEPPFPWLGLGLCTLGLTALVAAGWAAAWLFVTQFFDIDPIGIN